jgi:Protein of unknown function (DUF2996)
MTDEKNPATPKTADPVASGTTDASPADSTAAAPAAKKEKPPAIEAKPFSEFMQTHYLPTLKDGLTAQGISADLKLLKQKIPVIGYAQAPDCWQIEAKWTVPGQTRQFNLYFYDENIQGSRGFSITDSGRTASTLESFRIDEKKVTLDLLVSGTLQRLNSQKWLTRN